MDIILKPDALSLSGSLKRFIISTNNEITFVLKLADEDTLVVNHTYVPNKKHRIEIDLEDIVIPLLTFRLQNLSEPYRQENLIRKFTTVISEIGTTNSESWSFSVIRCGIDHLADTASNWLKANFLTWQPTVKPVTYYTPEFLTYYAEEDAIVHCMAYIANDESYDTHDFILANIPAGTVWTIPVQYAIIAGKLKKLPSYYDVWVETLTGSRLTYIQRYYASDIRSEEELWILFENSLGGIDTFRAYGNSENTAKHTHNIVELDKESEEYRVDTSREFKKNTGFLTESERKWLLDFFPSLGKYIYTSYSIRRIIVIDSDVTWQLKDLPSAYTFTYRYADSRPYLNISRMDNHADVLDIKIPDVGSFTIAPRLVELDRLSLSRGALFPVQDPYANKWNITTAAAILDWLTREITSTYNGDGALGHQHSNMSVLESLSIFDKYLLLGTQKISAGSADNATNADQWDGSQKDDYLDQPVRTTDSPTFKSITAKKANLTEAAVEQATMAHADVEQMTAKDATADAATVEQLTAKDAVMDAAAVRDLTVTGTAHFANLSVDEVKTQGGATIWTVANGFTVEKADYFTTGEALSREDTTLLKVGDALLKLTTAGRNEPKREDYKLWWRAEKDGRRTMNTWVVGDQALCQTFNVAMQNDRKPGNKLWWARVVETGTADTTINKETVQAHYIVVRFTEGMFYRPRLWDEATKTFVETDNGDRPTVTDEVVMLGHVPMDAVEDPMQTRARQNAVVESAYTFALDPTLKPPLRATYTGIDDFELSGHRGSYQSADETVIIADSMNIRDSSSTVIPIVRDYGVWSERQYDYYARVSHGGSLWLCNARSGAEATDVPGESSVWLLQVSKGAQGETGAQGDSPITCAIEVTDGDVFYREGQGYICTLTAAVYRGSREVTADYPPGCIVWQRESDDTAEADARWNMLHQDAGVSVRITEADLAGRTAIVLVVTDEHGLTADSEAVRYE